MQAVYSPNKLLSSKSTCPKELAVIIVIIIIIGSRLNKLQLQAKESVDKEKHFREKRLDKNKLMLFSFFRTRRKYIGAGRIVLNINDSTEKVQHVEKIAKVHWKLL